MPKSRRKPRIPRSSAEALAPLVRPVSAARNRLRDAAICAALLLLIAVAYWPVAGNDFINYDDSDYVTDNEYVRDGLTPHGIYTAFAAARAANWHPLTWISHMVDCQLFELRPAGHHLMSLAIHAANSILLYSILARMTAAAWPSAAVAAFFAVHPLHIESVAWVAERKDVLCTLFGLAALWAWLGYVARPGVGRYLSVVLFYAASLMSKSMLVTLPFLLLLLDWWPLGRVSKVGSEAVSLSLPLPLSPSRVSVMVLLLEKLPLALMAAASCVITVMAQSGGHAIVPLAEFSVAARFANIVLAYCGYLQKLALPVDLAPIYPISKTPSSPAAILFAIALAAATLLLLWASRRGKYLAVGWLWYLGLLVPVIGFVQVGQQSMADRYTYLPLVGIFILAAWTAADSIAGRRRLRLPVAALAAAALAVCCVLSNAQVRLWASTKTLFTYTVAVTHDNPVALTNLGLVAISEERFADAERILGAALRLDDSEIDALGNLANLYRKQRRYDDALKAYKKIDELCPRNPKCYYQIAETLEERGDHLRAEAYLRRALDADPQSILYHHRLAAVLQSAGKIRESLAEYELVLSNRPGATDVRNNIAWICATSPDAGVRNGARAIELLEPEAAKADCDANLLDTLAAAYAEAGQFDRAVQTAEKAARKARQAAVAAGPLADMEKRLELYKKHKPHRE
jgi:tetratricopeptide (TPR) repeat protein